MAQIHLRKYGVETTINFVLYGITGVDLKVDAAHASGDTKIMKDEGAEANTTNGFTDEGQGYAIVLTATEMQAARLVLYVVDTATKVWLDTAIIIETYGNASAMHAFDLGTATQSVNVSQISGDTTAADNAEAFFDGTGYAGTNNVIPTVTTVNGLAANVITATSIATDAITAAKIATDAIGASELADGAITAAKIAADAFTAAKFAADVTTEFQSGLATASALDAVDNLIDTEVAALQIDIDDIQARLPAALTAAGNMKSDALALNGSTAAAVRLALSAATIVSGAAIAGTLSTTQMTTNLTEATDDHYNGRIIIWTSGVLIDQATDITDYTGATKLLTFTAVTESPTAADTFIIV